MDNFNTSKPIPVKCDYWYFSNSSKEYSSSTIIFHQKKIHAEFPLSYSPYEIQCSKCLEIVQISGIHTHNVICEKKKLKEELGVIFEETSDSVRGICKHCKRKFAVDRIYKHQLACENASKKRPLYDMLKKRVPFGSDLKEKLCSKRGSINLIYPNSKWQKQHLDLIKNLRREEETSIYDDYVECPFCLRKFAPIPAEKHIEICKSILNKPKPPPSVISQRLPNMKKLEQPLSIRTNSMKSLWRPSSVYNNISFIDRKNSTNVMSNSIDETQVGEINTVDIALSPIKFSNENYPQNLTFIDIREATPVTCPKCFKKIVIGSEKEHLSECNKYLRPSATVKNLDKEAYHEKLLKTSIRNVSIKKRSNSTQRVNETTRLCKKCKSGLPAKANFCMMCGTMKEI